MNEPNVTISIDGDKWCFLIGEDLQSGISGFGQDPNEALVDLLKNIDKSIRPEDSKITPWAKTLELGPIVKPKVSAVVAH